MESRRKFVAALSAAAVGAIAGCGEGEGGIDVEERKDRIADNYADGFEANGSATATWNDALALAGDHENDRAADAFARASDGFESAGEHFWDAERPAGTTEGIEEAEAICDEAREHAQQMHGAARNAADAANTVAAGNPDEAEDARAEACAPGTRTGSRAD